MIAGRPVRVEPLRRERRADDLPPMRSRHLQGLPKDPPDGPEAHRVRLREQRPLLLGR